MAIFTVLRLVVSSVLFPYIKRSKVVDCVQSQLTNLCRMKEPRTDSPWNRQILKARSVSYLFPYSWVLRCVYCGKCFLKFLVLGNLTCAQEPRWPRVAWWTRTGYSILHDKIWIFLPSDSLPIAPERCLELSSWMSVFRMFASRIMPKRLFKQWKEGFKKTGRTLSENGRPEIFARNGTIPAKTGGLESLY